MDDTLFGRQLTYWRRKRGWQQQELAEALGVSHETLSRLECGHHLPRWELAVEIAKMLHISLDKFAREEVPEEPPG